MNETLLEPETLKCQYFFYASVKISVVGGRRYLPLGTLDVNSAPFAGQSALHAQEEVPPALLFLAFTKG